MAATQLVDGSPTQFHHRFIACRSSILGLELSEDASDVLMNCPDTDFQDTGDYSVLFSFHHPVEHLGFARSQTNPLEILWPGNDLIRGGFIYYFTYPSMKSMKTTGKRKRQAKWRVYST